MWILKLNMLNPPSPPSPTENCAFWIIWKKSSSSPPPPYQGLATSLSRSYHHHHYSPLPRTEIQNDSIFFQGTLLEWRNVFWVSFFMLVSTNVIFVLLGSGEVQPFNELTEDSDSSCQGDSISEKPHYPGTKFSTENENGTQSRKQSTIIDGIPIDPTRRPSVFIVRPIIKWNCRSSVKVSSKSSSHKLTDL